MHLLGGAPQGQGSALHYETLATLKCRSPKREWGNEELSGASVSSFTLKYKEFFRPAFTWENRDR